MTNQHLAVITGATGEIGAAIAAGIGSDANFALLLLVRDAERGRRAVERVKHATRNESVSFAVVDLSLRRSIRQFAADFTGAVNVLVNAAAIAPRSRQVTPEGRERGFATNVLGYYWLTLDLLPNLINGAPARVVNVASYWAGGMDLDDLEFQRRPYDNHSAYRQSKHANRMMTVALAEQLQPYGISVNACHPGDVNSSLSNSLGFSGSESPQAGARTPVWLALDETMAGVTGKYFEGRAECACQFAQNRMEIERLVEVCRRAGSDSSSNG